MLIFDGFPNVEAATRFVAAAKSEGHEADLADYSTEEGDDSSIIRGVHRKDLWDGFPFNLDPPIVLVSRDDDLDRERNIEALVVQFQGRFAGT